MRPSALTRAVRGFGETPEENATSRANTPNKRPGQAAREAPPVALKAQEATHAGRAASATIDDPDK